jgi:MFS family permease
MSDTSLIRLGVSRRNFLVVFILLFNALTWFYGIWATLDKSLRNLETVSKTFIWVVYFAAIIMFGILGSVLSNKFRTIYFLCFWMLFGALSSPLLLLLNSPNIISASLVSFSLGVTFGLGMPLCLTYFADSSIIENRGRVAGVILLGVNLGSSIFAILVRMFDLLTNSIGLTLWRLLGLILIFLLNIQEIGGERKHIPFQSIFHERGFILFIVPWLLFCLINSFEAIILQRILEADFYRSMQIVEAIIGSVFAFIGGWLCDLIGRKRVVIYGFIALGLAYAIISIFPSPITWYFYFIIDGFSAGMLWVAFILILWADLSQQGGREKYYAIGGIPYFAAPLIRLLLAPFVYIPAYAAFSLASFFLFLAVIPLMYAPETLPEKKLEARKLKQYIEEAKKLKEKHVKRNKQ